MKDVAKGVLHSVEIPLHEAFLNGFLFIPERPIGLVLFVHGSGSSRFSSRNKYVAEELHRFGLGTLLFDLLTPDEEAVDNYTREYRFDIMLLAQRLIAAAHWSLNQLRDYRLPLGYFGSSTGGAAALVAAAAEPELVKVIVSRGGRPDLAKNALSRVTAPTLLIVGELDEVVIELNQIAMQQMECQTQLEIIQGATHLFEEPGKLEEVAQLTANWFKTHFLLNKPFEI